jgi:uncharacterized iron-regulated membrane protein
MQVGTIRKWSWVHKWSSLTCTVFLLMLCITGLPLIFHHEIDDLLYDDAKPAARAEGAPSANLDELTRAAMARAPGGFVQFLLWDRDEPDEVVVSIGKAPDSDTDLNRNLRMDGGTGQYLDEPDISGRITSILLKLHSDMFAGLPGKLFLGLMGILFLASIVSGVVVYGPSMRKLEFGTVRTQRSMLAKWLDIHNLLGAVAIGWVLVVAATGVINTWADLAINTWQYTQLSDMVGQLKERPTTAQLASVQAAVDTARSRLPEMTPYFVAYPGSMFSGKNHFAVFMRGNTPLTSRLLKPVLIDAADGSFADSRDLPWYMSGLLLSQPLHFGDYGGLPLKIIWALFDVAAIVILASGLYLWLARRPKRAVASSTGAAAASINAVPLR